MTTELLILRDEPKQAGHSINFQRSSGFATYPSRFSQTSPIFPHTLQFIKPYTPKITQLLGCLISCGSKNLSS